MLGSYRELMTSTQPVRPSSSSSSSSVAVISFVVKFLKCLGVFLAYDILKVVSLPAFLFILQFISCTIIYSLQQPLKTKRYSLPQLWKVFWFACLDLLLLVLWSFALTLCGPLRTMLIYELNDVVVLNAVNSFAASSARSKSRMRGVLLLGAGVTALLFFDNDNADKLPKHPEGHHTNMLTHWIYSIFNITGFSDHKIGVLILIVALVFAVALRNYQKKLSLEIGGQKSLQALSNCLSTAVLFPPALLTYIGSNGLQHGFSWLHIMFLMILVTILVVVIPFYMEAYASKLDQNQAHLWGTIGSVFSAVAVAVFWTRPYIGPVEAVTQLAGLTEDHLLSGGVIVAAILFVFATSILGAPVGKPSKGSFIGYATDGQPVYTYANQAFLRTTSSVKNVLKNGITQIISEKDSRQIFYFLCVNLAFTFVELVYGAWTNSLGLISDGFHMLFDCSALCLGLFAAVMSKWKSNTEYPYGYGRVEVLSGFVNALFLAVIAFFVLTEALERLFDPPTVNTDRLLIVSVAGLLVNLFGIFAFHEAHHHAHGGGGCSHDHGHKHSHDHDDDGDEDHHEHTATNTNMKGVFLHVLADTLGSCGVIVSSLLIQYFGWNIADPICSLFIAILIGLSIIPLITETAKILLNAVPSDMQSELNACLIKIDALEGVVGYRDPHFWRHSSSLVCATIHVQVEATASEQKITQMVIAILKEAGAGDIAVQVEKEEFYHHMSGINNTLKYSSWPSSRPTGNSLNSL